MGTLISGLGNTALQRKHSLFYSTLNFNIAINSIHKSFVFHNSSMETVSKLKFTAILKHSPLTIYTHFEKKKWYTLQADISYAVALWIRFSAVVRKNRLRHLDRPCTKCHQVVQLRLRTILQSVISWLSFDFRTVNTASCVSKRYSYIFQPAFPFFCTNSL